jgi:hypothetical protein
MKKAICAGLLIMMMGAVGVYSSDASTFAGLVINASDASIEIKKNRKELTLFWTADTKVVINGKEADRSAVVVCQKVEASYVKKDGRRELVRVEIVRESYCFQ